MSDTGSAGLPPAGTGDNTALNTLLAGGVLALLALAAFLGYEVLTGSSGGPPELQIIEVSIDRSCASRIEAKVTANQGDRDVLVWRIKSECSTVQNVLMCVTPDGSAPPLRCWGDPDTALLDKPFAIDAAQGAEVTSYLICALKWPPANGVYKYDVEFLTGDASKTLVCPTNKDYELALDVLP